MKAERPSRIECCRAVGQRFPGERAPALDRIVIVSREVLGAKYRRFTVGRLSGLITLDFRWGTRKGPGNGKGSLGASLRKMRSQVRADLRREEKTAQLFRGGNATA